MNGKENKEGLTLEITVMDLYGKENIIIRKLSVEDETALEEILLEKVHIEPKDLLAYLLASSKQQADYLMSDLRKNIAHHLAEKYDYDKEYAKKVMSAMKVHTPSMDCREKKEWESTKNRMRYRMKEGHEMVAVYGGLIYYPYSFSTDTFYYIRNYDLFEITNYKIA